MDPTRTVVARRIHRHQFDNVGGAQRLLLDIGIDFHNLAVLYDYARVRSAIVTNAVEQPTAANNQLPFLPVGPLRQHQLWSEQDQYDFAKQGQGAFHLVTDLT